MLDEPPRMRNTETVRKLMEQYYPPELKARGIGGTTVIAFVLREDSVSEDFRVVRSSGYPELDQASIRVLSAAEFSPGRYKGCPVRVSMDMPIAWEVERRPSAGRER